MKLKQNFIIALTLSLLFGLGWGVGLIATNSIPVPAISYTLQAIFILLTSFQGLLIFIMHCVRSEDARKQWKIWVHIITCRKVSLEAKKSISGYTSSEYGKGTHGKHNKYATLSTSAHAAGSQTLQRILKKELNSSMISQADSVIENEYSTFSPTLDPMEEEKLDLSSDALPKPVQEDVVASANPFSANNAYVEVNLNTYDDEMEMEDFKKKGSTDTHSLHSVKISRDSKVDTKSLHNEADYTINKFDILWVKNGSQAGSHLSLNMDEKRKSRQSGLEVALTASPIPTPSPGEATSPATQSASPSEDSAAHKNTASSDEGSSSPVMTSIEKMPLIEPGSDVTVTVNIPDEDVSDKVTIL